MDPSDAAWHLYHHLRAKAHAPESAQTDAWLAEYLALPQRDLVDLADELLQAGILVVARCVRPFGRWLLLPDDPDPAHWAEAREYVQGLQDRGVRILARRQHAEHALRVTESQRAPAPTSRGQGQLF